MFTFVKNEISQIDIEKEIMNSNLDFNLIAYDKELLEEEDILKEHKEAKNLDVERYFVKKGEEYIGILDYGMSSPRLQKPWISLLIVHKKYQGLGYVRKVYMMYEKLMKDKQVNGIQLAVHSTNKKALDFWTSLGFVKYDERVYEGKVFFSMEKQLND